MKHYYFGLLSVALLLSSCAQTFHFVQVFEATSSSKNAPVYPQNGGLVYEDDKCILFYSLWAERGDASFAIHNKTDQIMYVDLSKSFFIRNGIANDYYKERAWSETKTNTLGVQTTSSSSVSGSRSYSNGASATYLGNFGNLPLGTNDPILTSANAQRTDSYGLLYSTAVANSYATSKSASVAVKEQKIIALPPHATKIVAEYAITDELLLNCDLERYPSETSSITYDENNSPLSFSNYVTFRIGENEQDIVVKNDFYVSKITNYARPYTYKYVEREKRPCKNLTSDDSRNYKETYPVKVYDKIYTFSTGNCFYLEYEKLSNHKLYKSDEKTYYYNSEYQGYTTGSGGWVGSEQDAYRQRLLNPFGQQK